jgi:hypothetical protein
VIWTHIDARFGSRSGPTQIEFVFQSFLFGMASYIVVYAGYWLFGFNFIIIDLSKVETQNLLTSTICWFPRRTEPVRRTGDADKNLD